MKLFTPKRIQDFESQVLNSAIIVKTWEHGIAKQCNISKLGMPSLEQKSDRFRKLVCQVLAIIFTCVHVLENQVMKDIILTYTVEIIYPKRIQDLESQVLNNAIIVKTWEHGIAKQYNISNLGNVQCLECKMLKQQAVHVVSLHSPVGKTYQQSKHYLWQWNLLMSILIIPKSQARPAAE